MRDLARRVNQRILGLAYAAAEPVAAWLTIVSSHGDHVGHGLF